MRNRERPMHLFRGAPCVQGWSKYQETVQEWTLCGIPKKPRKGGESLTIATEDPQAVNCPMCQELMKPTKADQAKIKRQKLAS